MAVGIDVGRPSRAASEIDHEVAEDAVKGRRRVDCDDQKTALAARVVEA